jgi:hypothetical protein
VSWFALHRSEEGELLIEKHPNAFLLLTQIAMRARFKEEPCPVTGLAFGQCFIGDFISAGLPSRKAYRLAKEKLLECGFGAFQGTNKGTIATLLPNPIYSISPPPEGPAEGPPKGQQGANKGPLTNKDTKKQGDKGHATEEEIIQFVVSIDLPKSDGEACFHKWKGNGWKNGTNPIKDWQATIRSWKASGYLPSQKNAPQQTGGSKWKTD